MLSESVGGSETDGEGEEEGNEPCEQHDLVIPADVADDEVATEQASGDEHGGEDQCGSGNGKDGGPAIWDRASVCRIGIGHGHGGDMGSVRRDGG